MLSTFGSRGGGSVNPRAEDVRSIVGGGGFSGAVQ